MDLSSRQGNRLNRYSISKKTLVSLALSVGVSFGGSALFGSSSAYADSTSWDFSYTGSVQSFKAPYTGTYQLEVWGAQGGNDAFATPSVGGLGGYANGDVNLTAGETLYVYVGQQGQHYPSSGSFPGTFNGGGGGNDLGDGTSGGGATDVRTTSDGNWQDHLDSRLIVAGGGGGGGVYGSNGGNGGGETGGNGDSWNGEAIGNGGTPTSGGVVSGTSLPNDGYGTATEGSFGQGGTGAGFDAGATGGGSGWYGGGGGENSGAGGGSGYIGGVINGVMDAGNQTMPAPFGGTEVGQSGNGYARITLLKPADITPPITRSSISGKQGNNGWYVDPVQLSLSATDDSGVAATYYSTDGGTTWQTYNSTLSFSADGKYIVEDYSVDNAGNKETAQTVSFNIDQTAPTFSITAPTNGSYLDDKSLTVAYSVSDSMSGVDNSTVGATLDGQSISNGTTIPLYTLSLGSHIFTVNASDNAGNVGTQTVTFQVGTSLDSVKQLVSLFTSNGSIDNGGISNAMTAKLGSGDLKGFVNQVEAQSGKHINATVAKYLLRDANFLIGQ